MSAGLVELMERLRAVSEIYAQRTGISRDGDWYLLKIQEELGELTAEYLRLNGGKQAKNGIDQMREALADEAADLLAQVLLFIDDADIDIDAALHRKWLKHLDK